MSSSPADSDWLDESLPLPQAGLIWPWILAGSLLFVAGLWLLYPRAQERLRPKTSPLAVQSQTATPTSLQTPRRSGELDFLVVDSASSSFGHSAERLDQLVTQATNGQLGFKLHTSGSFGGKKLDELSIIDEVRQGRAQIAIVTSSPLTNFSPDFEVLDLPFLLQSHEHADRVLRGPVGERLLKGLEKQGLVGLGYMEIGFRVFSSSVPLPSLGDFRGKKVRVMQSSTAIQMARQLGCEAIPSPVDKIYQMGKEGFIDAADRTYPTYWDFKLYEVHRYITESRHSYTVKVIVMNKDAYDRLPPNQRDALRKAVRTVETEQRQEQRKTDLEVKQQCRKMGIQIFELGQNETKRFSEACKPLYQEFEKLHGGELVTAIQKEAP